MTMLTREGSALSDRGMAHDLDLAGSPPRELIVQTIGRHPQQTPHGATFAAM